MKNYYGSRSVNFGNYRWMNLIYNFSVLLILSVTSHGEADTRAECKKLLIKSRERYPRMDLPATMKTSSKTEKKETKSPSSTLTTCASWTGKSTRQSTATRDTTRAKDEARFTDKSSDLREKSRNISTARTTANFFVFYNPRLIIRTLALRLKLAIWGANY